MGKKFSRALEKNDSKIETLLHRLLDIATFLKWPIRIGVVVVGVLVISGFAFQPLRSGQGGVALLGLFFLPEIVFLVVGNIHHSVVFPLITGELDRAAKSAFDDSQTSFCVFIRPFEFDGCYFVSIPTVSPFGLLNGLTVDVEAHLASMTKELRMPLVALGGSPDQDFRGGRSGRTSSRETDWKDRVASALERSKAVFVIPSSHLGTLWELGLIASRPDFLIKTVFIMPPRPPSRPLIAMTRPAFSEFVERYEKRWVEAQNFTEQFGIILPDYTEKGAVFVFAADHASPTVLATLLPMTDEGTDRIIEYLIDRAGAEFLDDLLDDPGAQHGMPR